MAVESKHCLFVKLCANQVIMYQDQGAFRSRSQAALELKHKIFQPLSLKGN